MISGVFHPERLGRTIGRLSIALLIMAALSSLHAQITTARLNGTVTDTSGSVIPGATVGVLDQGTGYRQTVRSDAEGAYLFPDLPIGAYQLTVSMNGFATYVQNGITLAVGQSATQNVTLGVGQVSQKIVVNANANLVTTDNAQVGQLIAEKTIVGLPLNGRDVQQLVFVAPGATNVTSHYCAANCEGGVFPSEQYAKVNGAGSNGVSYLLDGVDYNDTYINTNVPFPNPDAIQEFNFITDNMSAAYGNAVGGVVNVVTRSGTDKIHGDAFEFLRNAAVDAANYFSPVVNPLHQNQFGGSIGGPILRDRLFYFGSYQGTRFSTQSNGQIAFVPNAAERTGDFSDLLPGTQLYNPYTGNAYSNNQVPVSPVATYILAHIPLPNAPDDQLNFNGGPDRQNTDEFLGKVDWNVGKHHLSGRYFQMNYTDPVFVPPTNDLLQLRGDSEHLVLKNVGAVDIYTVSPKFLLSTYFGYNGVDGTTLSASPFSMADAGVNIAEPPNNGGGNAPDLEVSVGGDFGLYNVPYGVWNRNTFSLREIATMTRGAHELQIGGELIKVRVPMGNIYQESGIFDFSNALTGDSLSDFVSGVVSNFTQGGGLYLNVSGWRQDLFIQDNWKASKRLVINAGLRWDPFYPYTDSLGRVACFVPGAQSKRFPNAPVGMLFGGDDHDPGCPVSSIYDNPYNFAPRLGFAYRLTQDGKTSVRGGAGYYYEGPNTVDFEDVVGVPPFAPVVNFSTVSLSDPYGSAGIANPFPAEFGPTNPGPNATFPSDIGFNQIFSRRFRLPMVLAYNLTLEHGIGQNWMLRMAYVGNTGRRLSGTGDQENGLLQLNPSIYIPGQSTENNIQQRRVYPQYGSVASINSGVNSNYNAGQFTLEKRAAHGFSFLTNFTWARALDDFAPPASSYLTNSCSCGRWFDYGPSNDDLNKDFKFDGDYAVPHMHIPAAAGKALNGWELTAIADWTSGFPFTIMSGTDNSFSAMGADRADLNGITNPGQAQLSYGRSHPDQINEWFNINDFAPNAIGTFGNSGKNSLRGPRYFDTDLAAIKTTKLSDRTALELRAEFFNAFNNVNFGRPDNILTDTAFGQITGLAGGSSSNTYGTAQPRIIQFAAKVSF
ncbi:MAG: carboxypeptidase-like regulatory domain-containing protein [Acidobacteriaceae bacterium]